MKIPVKEVTRFIVLIVIAVSVLLFAIGYYLADTRSTSMVDVSAIRRDAAVRRDSLVRAEVNTDILISEQPLVVGEIFSASSSMIEVLPADYDKVNWEWTVSENCEKVNILTIGLDTVQTIMPVSPGICRISMTGEVVYPNQTVTVSGKANVNVASPPATE